MKKKSIVIISTFLLSFLVKINAQIFDGGICGGINLSQIDGDRLSGFDKPGINAGAFIRLPVGGPFTVQGELKLNNKGAAQWGDVFNPSIYRVSLNYIEIPILLQAWFTEDLYGELGFSAGYLVSATYVDNTGALPHNPKDYYKSWDYNIVTGLSYLINDKTGINLRWAYSLTPAYEANTGFYRGFISDWFNLKDGYYNNFLSASVYIKLNNY